MELRFKNGDFKLAVFWPPGESGEESETFYNRISRAIAEASPDFVVLFAGGRGAGANGLSLLPEELPWVLYPAAGQEPVFGGGLKNSVARAVRLMGADGFLRWSLYFFGPAPKGESYLRTEEYLAERRRLDAYYYESGSLIFTPELLPEIWGLMGAPPGHGLSEGLLCAAAQDKRALALVSGGYGERSFAGRHMEKDIFAGAAEGSPGRVFSLNAEGRHGYEITDII